VWGGGAVLAAVTWSHPMTGPKQPPLQTLRTLPLYYSSSNAKSALFEHTHGNSTGNTTAVTPSTDSHPPPTVRNHPYLVQKEQVGAEWGAGGG